MKSNPGHPQTQEGAELARFILFMLRHGVAACATCAAARDLVADDDHAGDSGRDDRRARRRNVIL
jgi:hypothetical protein